MSLEQVILGAGSPDPNIRRPAEAQLKQLEAQNLPAYLGELCMYLGDESKSAEARQLAGLVLKNTLVLKNPGQRKHLAQRWLNLELQVRLKLKQMLCQILSSKEKRVRSTAALVIGQVARIEVPQGLWSDIVPNLVSNIMSNANAGNAALRQSSFETLGYVCEECPDALKDHSNQVLMAIHSGMRPEETSNEIKLEATKALANALEFIKGNMAQPNERKIIMTMVFDVLKCPEVQVREAAYQCLIQLAMSYYQYLGDCIGMIFELTRFALQNEKAHVQPYAIEIWCTICEEEMEIMDEIEEAKSKNQPPEQSCQNIIKAAQASLVPQMLMCLTKQSEDVEDDDVDAAKAAALCISLIAQTTRNEIVPIVVPFIHEHIVSQNWRFKEAAILAFGCILDGPDVDQVKGLVEKAFPLLIGNMQDPQPLVKDTTAWCIGQICKFVPETINPEILERLMIAMVIGLKEVPKTATSVAWAIHNLADVLKVDEDSETTVLSPYTEGLLSALLGVTTRTDVGESNLVATAYEAINVLIRKAAKDKHELIAKLIPVLMEQLKNNVTSQGLTGEERNRQMEIQGLLCASLSTIISKLGKKGRQVIFPFADNLMICFLKVLQTKQASTHEDAFGAISAVAGVVEKDFERYMSEVIKPVLEALDNVDEIYTNQSATGLVSELATALHEKIMPFADEIMKKLLANLQSADVERTSKPHIVSTMSDVALAIGPHFNRYLKHVMDMLISASRVKCEDGDYETQDYVLQLRESILEAYVVILSGLESKAAEMFGPYVGQVVHFFDLIMSESEREDSILRTSASLIGDLSRALHGHKNIGQALNRPSVQQLLQEAQGNSDEETRTQAQYASAEINKMLNS